MESVDDLTDNYTEKGNSKQRIWDTNQWVCCIRITSKQYTGARNQNRTKSFHAWYSLNHVKQFLFYTLLCTKWLDRKVWNSSRSFISADWYFYYTFPKFWWYNKAGLGR